MTELSGSRAGPRAWPVLLLSAVLIAGWDAGTWWWHIRDARWTTLPDYLFRTQDLPLLGAVAIGLLALIPLSGGRRMHRADAPSGWAIAFACIAAIVVARLGRELVFHGYAPSRDEIMVELAGAYMADGHIGWPIPHEWLPWARAMMPEFYSPYGAGTVWTSIYLPVHAAIRALFTWMGDADLAAPATLGVGLLALWDVAGRVFPGRADARAVVMVMALTSTQLLATAMTPYAMTSHFALNLVWLALVLRGGMAANLLAGVVLLAAAGLHQWHFPILFAGPVILWLFWRRQWGSAVFQTGALMLSVLVWAKLWPLWLAHVLGPAGSDTAGPAPEVGEKIASLFDRLDRWQPLLNIGRLIAWNDILLLPLCLLSLGRLPRTLRGWLAEPPILLPLLGMVAIGVGTALYQGYGWGFRYMHGAIGALCLIAGYGWTVLSPEGRRPLRLVWAGAALSLLAAAWLLVTTEQHVRPYARTMAAIRASRADAVLVDIRGGFFMTDLVRFKDGRPGKPAVMALAMMDDDQIRSLCARHSVAIMDHGQFWSLGVHPVSPIVSEGPWLDSRRKLLDQLDCGRPVITE